MFYTAIKKLQLHYNAQTWQETLRSKEMIRNSYHVSGDVKKAKAFVQSVVSYKPHTHFTEHGEHVIFSYEGLTLATEPAYNFV